MIYEVRASLRRLPQPLTRTLSEAVIRQYCRPISSLRRGHFFRQIARSFMESNVAELPLSHRAWAWFEKNQKPALMGATIAVVAGLAVWFLLWRSGERQIDAGNALSNVGIAQGTAFSAAPSAQAYLKVATDYPSSRAAARAVLLAGGTLFSEGKYSEAQAQFEKFSKDYHDSPLLGEALVGIASCLEAQGKLDQAVAAYKDIQARHPNDSVIPQVKFSLGGLYEAQKRPELAREMYRQVSEESRYTILGSEASLRLGELAQKNPNLPPALGTTTALPTATATVSAVTGTNPPAPATKK